MRVSFVWCGVVTLLLACATEESPEQLERDEASGLLVALDRLRAAPNPGKSQALGALTQLRVTQPSTTALKARCAEAYAAHVHALDGLEQARSAEPALAPALLAGATSELERAKQGTLSCADLQSSMRLRLR